MNIAEHIGNVFPKASSWGQDADIVGNPNVMELPGSIDLMAAVPAYMLWCTQHPDSAELVSDFTLAALAEYGRCKNPDNRYLNFRYLCSPNQLEVVVSFLEWAAQTFPFSTPDMIDRALRNWRNTANISTGARRSL